MTDRSRGAIAGLMTAVLALLVSGCSSVSVPQPFGERVADAETAAKLQGAWAGGDDGILHVKSLGDGKFQVGWLEWEEKQGQFVVRQVPFEIRKVAEQTLLFVRSQDEPKSGEKPEFFLSSLAGPENDVVVVRPMRVENIAAFVQDGTLAGKAVSKHTVRLDAAAAEGVTALLKGQPEDLINYESFSALRRVQAVK